jgi:hypothetical protein
MTIDIDRPFPDCPADDGWTWAIVEIFGRRLHAGRTREQEMFGVTMLRIDVPVAGDPARFGWKSHFYAGSAVFSFSLTDEAVAINMNAPHFAAARLPYAEHGAFEEKTALPF